MKKKSCCQSVIFPMATDDVRALVASFLVNENDLLDAGIYHPNAWIGVSTSHSTVLNLLTLAPISAFELLGKVPSVSKYRRSVARAKGRRRITINENDANLSCWFFGACEGGHVDIVREYKSIELIFEDEMFDCVKAIVEAVRYGHLDVVQALLAQAKLDDERVFENFDSIVMAACEYGRVDILQELRKNWNVTKEDVTGDHEPFKDEKEPDLCGLALAAANGHVGVFVELRENWHLDKSDITNYGCYVFRTAVNYGRAAVLEEVRTHWMVTTDDVLKHILLSKPIPEIWPLSLPQYCPRDEYAAAAVYDALSNEMKVELSKWGFAVPKKRKSFLDRIDHVLRAKRTKNQQ